MEELKKPNHVFPRVDWNFEDIIFDDGFILDIGGGGEGVIGKLMGDEVIAIDFKKEELQEAAEGPIKIIMDARDLKFLDESFQTVTAFFSFMYFKGKSEQEKVFQEVARVLKPGGRFHLWDVDLGELPETDKEFYIVFLRYSIRGESKDTGYGMRWPTESRGINDYLEMAKTVGLRAEGFLQEGNTFYLGLVKD